MPTTAELKSFQALDEKIRRTIELVSRLKKDNAEIKAKFASLDEAKGELSHVTEVLKEEKAELAKVVSGLEKEKASLERTNESLSTRNSELEIELATLKDSLDEGATAAEELKTMRLSQDQLAAELTSLKEEREDVLSRVDGLLADLDKISLD